MDFDARALRGTLLHSCRGDALSMLPPPSRAFLRWMEQTGVLMRAPPTCVNVGYVPARLDMASTSLYRGSPGAAMLYPLTARF